MSRECSLWANKTVIYLLSCEMVIVKCFGARYERWLLPEHEPRNVEAMLCAPNRDGFEQTFALLSTKLFRRSMHINLSENVLFTERLNLTDTTRSHSLHFYLHPLENVNEAGAEQRMLNEQRTRWTEKSSSNTKHTHLESFQAAAFRYANISWTSVIMKLPKGLNFIFRKCFRS